MRHPAAHIVLPFLLAAASIATAQVPPPAGRGMVLPTPGGSGGAKEGTVEATNPNDKGEVSSINLVDADTHAVLDLIERYTKREILRSQDLPVVKINFTSRSPMTTDDAVRVLESLLSINGVGITDIDARYRRAVPANRLQQNVPVLRDGTSTTAEPNSNRMYAQFFKLEYLLTTEALPLVTPVLSTGTPVAFEKSNSILVVDTLANLKRIEELLSRIDKPAEPLQKPFFKDFKHISAADALVVLQNLQKGPLKTRLETSSFELDERTNSLMIFTHPANYELLNPILAKLDADVAPVVKTDIIPLKYAYASDVVDLIQQIMTGEGSGSSSGSSTRTGSSRSSTSSSPTSSSSSRSSSRNTTMGGSSDRSGSSSSTTGSSSSSRRSAVSAANIAGAGKGTEFSENLNIVADPNSDNIIVSGTDKDIAYVKRLVEKLDTLLPQVLLDVVVCEVTLEEKDASGIQAFSAAYSSANGGRVAGGIPGLSIAGDGTIGAGTDATRAMTLKDFSIEGVLTTATYSNKISVLGNPSVVATHRKEGIIEVTERRPLIMGATTNNNSDTTSEQIEYESIGLKLSVIPKVGSDGTITLDIDQTAESIIGNTTINGNEQPIIGQRIAKSTVSVRDREMVVLGGLQEHRKSDNKGKFPIIGHIPIVGDLVNPTSNEITRRDLLIFIRPTVMTTTAKANDVARERMEKVNDEGRVQNLIDSGTFGLPSERDKDGNYERFNMGRLPGEQPTTPLR